MSEFLWCPECRQAFVDEERMFFAQRCTDCGGLLETEETGRCEVDYKELDIGYREEEEQHEDVEADEEVEDQEDADDTETEGEAE
ncbi:hypothetical protein ACVWZM_003030 [Bradyrhizobium sp. USDA 4501]